MQDASEDEDGDWGDDGHPWHSQALRMKLVRQCSFEHPNYGFTP